MWVWGVTPAHPAVPNSPAPGSPSKRPSASGPSIGGPTSSSSLMLMGGQKMIPVMSMDRLDEANVCYVCVFCFLSCE